MRLLTTLALAAFALTLQASAQQTAAPAQQPAPAKAQTSDISVEARLVVVPVVVRDKKNNLLTNLKKDDFVLQVDGKPQPVRYFDHDSDVPLTVGLLVDTSQSQRSVLDDERSASSTFLDKMLASDRDKAFLIQFAHSVDLLQDITPSRPRLQEALKQLDSDRPSFDNSSSGSGNNSNDNSGYGGQGRDRHDRGQSSGGGTALYDAVYLASDEVLAKQKGRLALILLTDGDDRGSKVTLAHSIEAAQRSNAIIYAIYYKGEHPSYGGGHGGFPGGGGHHGGGFPGGGGGPFDDFAGQRGGGYGQNQVDGKKVLERMCGETGGRVYEVSKKLTVDAIYIQIAEELRTQYRLGFTPTAEAASEGYHQISLTLTGEATKAKPILQTRDGYYTGAAK